MCSYIKYLSNTNIPSFDIKTNLLKVFFNTFAMKTIISERLSQIIKELGINKNKLAIELGYKNSVVGNVVNQRNLPSFDFLLRLKQFENRINMNWLIAGEGTIFVDENKNSDDHEKLEVYKDLIDSLKRENTLLRDKIERIEQSNDCKNKRPA